MKKLLSTRNFKIYFYICLVGIEFLATTTTVHIEIVESMWDKSNHFIAFFVLYILLSFGYTNLTFIKKVMLLLIFGIQIELVQELIGRSQFSGFDLIADAIGIFIGLIVIFLKKHYNSWKL